MLPFRKIEPSSKNSDSNKHTKIQCGQKYRLAAASKEDLLWSPFLSQTYVKCHVIKLVVDTNGEKSGTMLKDE